MNRPLKIIATLSTTLLLACAGPAPQPQPGMELIHWGRNEELQVAKDVDWSRYKSVLLHSAPVEFRDNWERSQERIIGSPIDEDDMERIRSGVSGQFGKVMFKTLSEDGGYELTSESGEGIMRFSPSIVELDIQAPGRLHATSVESAVNTRGSMRIELVITDAESGELLAAAWQQQSDPHGGDVVESTTSVSNTLAFRRMMQNWADWLVENLKEQS